MAFTKALLILQTEQELHFGTEQSPLGLDERLLLALYLVPSIVSVCVILVRIFSTPVRGRPKWTKSFIYEPNEERSMLELSPEKHAVRPATALSVLCLVGLALQAVTMMHPSQNYAVVPHIMTWVG